MTPNEIEVLKIVEERDKVSKRMVADLLGMSTDYTGYILESQANGGYFKMATRGIYALLPKGIDALLSRLYFAESKIEADMDRLSMDKERVKQEIERLSARKESMVTAELVSG